MARMLDRPDVDPQLKKNRLIGMYMRMIEADYRVSIGVAGSGRVVAVDWTEMVLSNLDWRKTPKGVRREVIRTLKSAIKYIENIKD